MGLFSLLVGFAGIIVSGVLVILIIAAPVACWGVFRRPCPACIRHLRKALNCSRRTALACHPPSRFSCTLGILSRLPARTRLFRSRRRLGLRTAF